MNKQRLEVVGTYMNKAVVRMTDLGGLGTLKLQEILSHFTKITDTNNIFLFLFSNILSCNISYSL